MASDRMFTVSSGARVHVYDMDNGDRPVSIVKIYNQSDYYMSVWVQGIHTDQTYAEGHADDYTNWGVIPPQQSLPFRVGDSRLQSIYVANDASVNDAVDISGFLNIASKSTPCEI